MRTSAAAVLLVLALPGGVLAQEPEDPTRGHATRAQLTRSLERLDGYARSPAYSVRLQARARERAELIRARLQHGDFQVGDRILLTVERESALTDTFALREGPALVLPGIGSIPFEGVLRAEAQEHLGGHIARYVRDPVVRTRTVIRVGVEGAVGAPGFYNLETDLPITDALARAGGASGEAELDRIEVRRDGRLLLAAEQLRTAVARGSTIDELNLRAGDRILVPERGSGLSGLEAPLRAVSILVAIPTAIFGLTRIF